MLSGLEYTMRTLLCPLKLPRVEGRLTKEREAQHTAAEQTTDTKSAGLRPRTV
jgi:hypothetical protein